MGFLLSGAFWFTAIVFTIVYWVGLFEEGTWETPRRKATFYVVLLLFLALYARSVEEQEAWRAQHRTARKSTRYEKIHHFLMERS